MSKIISYKIKELVDQLNKYREAYYNKNISLISDKEYDELLDDLIKLEKESGIILSNSPTQNVGYTVVSQLNKVKHNHPLLSLAKTTDVDEFFKYFNGKTIALMAKLDGLTCSLFYKDGELVRAESRGDGEVGEDITHNAKVFSNLPTKIPFKGELIIDGECIITYDEFKEINKRENTEYKNPRNLVSGSVRQLDSHIAKNRNIKFIAWKVYEIKNEKGESILNNSHHDNLLNIRQWGFDYAPIILIPEGENEEKGYHAAINFIKDICFKDGIPIDGLVGMFDDVEYGMSLGSTGHHPKHSLAFKFYQEDIETTLQDIEWSPSRTGTINPVAIFDPVEIDGTTVSRATLNNVSIIEELKLGIGDTITVIKANQIIPCVTKNLTQSNTYQIPKFCPCCDSPAVVKADNDRKILYCTNNCCPAVIHDKISNFVTRDAMNIVGLSDKKLNVLMELGFVTDFKSLYKLKEHRTDLISIQGFGKTSADALLNAIEKSKKCKLANVLVAIGIPGIGKSAARIIEKHCLEKSPTDSFRTFLKLAIKDYDWSVLSEIGEVTSENINNYVLKNITELQPLVDILQIEQGISIRDILTSKSFCITGKLYIFENRDSLVANIEQNGGVVVSGVTAKTDFLITNDKTSGSSKNLAAKKFGTKVITEQEYKEMIKYKTF